MITQRSALDPDALDRRITAILAQSRDNAAAEELAGIATMLLLALNERQKESDEQRQRWEAYKAELHALIDKSETARRAWTEIGARSEATAVALRGVLDEAAQALFSSPDPSVFARQLAARLRERARAHYETPLLTAAERVAHAWDRLVDCVDEFEPADMETCAEYRDALDTAILALKSLLEGDKLSR